MEILRSFRNTLTVGSLTLLGAGIAANAYSVYEGNKAIDGYNQYSQNADEKTFDTAEVHFQKENVSQDFGLKFSEAAGGTLLIAGISSVLLYRRTGTII